MRKKVLILTPFYPPNIGGAETYTEALAKECKKEHQTDVLCYGPFDMKKTDRTCFENGCFVKRIKWPINPGKAWSGTGIFNTVLAIPKLLVYAIQRVKRFDYDVIHAQGLCAAFIAYVLKIIFKKRYLVTLLALYNFKEKGKFFKFICRKILSESDTVFVEGHAGTFDILPLNILGKIFQHWVEPIDYELKENKTGKLNILFCGRPIPEKNKVFVQAVEAQLNSTDYRFCYIENVSQEILRVSYKWADILLVPSNYAEGFVRVIAEASQYGCAIIASDKGALPEMLSDFGFSLKLDVYIWADTLRMYKRKPELLYLEQALSIQKSKEKFSPKNAEIMIQEY